MGVYSFEIKGAAETETEELNTNIKTLLETREGSQPGDRSFGISWNCLDEPSDIAECMFVAELIEKINRYEPRLEVDDIEFTREEERLKPKITFRRKERE